MARHALTIVVAALLASCGSLQETTQVRDDVYDIPDRNAVASVNPVPAEKPATSPSDDYYDPATSIDQQRRNYYDMTYNDPRYYNYGRFGFGMGINSWGPSYGMGMSYGWPYTSTMYNSPTGWYDPYWDNSWMSGYGAWGSYYNRPYSFYNYGYNSAYYGPYGYYDPFASGWGSCGSYMGPGGSYYGCYVPWSSSPTVVAHRPGMGGSGMGSGNTTNNHPRRMRSNAYQLLPSQPDPVTRPHRTEQRPQRDTRPARIEHDRPSRDNGNQRWNTPHFDTGGSRGGGGGGGSTPAPVHSPLPRR
jgi:hypothetical protein